MENDRIVPVNENFFHSDQQQESIYTKNLKNNKEKLSFWSFLMYSAKAEIYICEFHNLLFWVSLLEIFLYLIGLALFISSPNNFPAFWAFTTHFIRAILGFIVLRRLPNSSSVIEQIKEFENSTIEDLQNSILETYKNLLTNNEGRIKPVIKAYFAFTIIDIIVDNIIFFFLLEKWSDDQYSLENIFVLVLIVTFFICNGVYFSWATGIKFNFPKKMRKPIFLIMFGRLAKLHKLLIDGAKDLYNKAANKFGRGTKEENNRKKGEQIANVELNKNIHGNNLENDGNLRNFQYEKPQFQIV